MEGPLRFAVVKLSEPLPSLRANGSRERAPDDRLREAIHGAQKRKRGLLRRFRLRSFSYGGQVAPRNDEGEEACHNPLPVIASAAKQSMARKKEGRSASSLTARSDGGEERSCRQTTPHRKP